MRLLEQLNKLYSFHFKVTPSYAPDRICLWIIQRTFTRFLFVLLFRVIVAGDLHVVAASCLLYSSATLAFTSVSISSTEGRKYRDSWLCSYVYVSISFPLCNLCKSYFVQFSSYSFVFVVQMQKFVSIETYDLFVFGCVHIWNGVMCMYVGKSVFASEW